MQYWYFKCLSPNHPLMIPIIANHGMEGYGYACALFSEAAPQNCYLITVEHLKKWLGLRTQKAKKLLPEFQKLLLDFAELQKITVINQEITETIQEITPVIHQITAVNNEITPVIPRNPTVIHGITAVTDASNPVIAENSVLPLIKENKEIDRNKEINKINTHSLLQKNDSVCVSDFVEKSFAQIDPIKIDPLVSEFTRIFLQSKNPNLMNTSANEMTFTRIINESRAKGYTDIAIKAAWLMAVESCTPKQPTGLNYYVKVFEAKLLEQQNKPETISAVLSQREKLEQASRFLDVRTSEFYTRDEIEIKDDVFVIKGTSEICDIERLTAV